MLLYHLLTALCSIIVTEAYFPACDPSQYICAGSCPPLPEGVPLDKEGPICLFDSKTDACVCWLRNPSKQLNGVFQCTATINGSESQILCQAPGYCFQPNPEPRCLIVTNCGCQNHASSSYGSWRFVKAVLFTGIKTSEPDGGPVEKVTSDIREFSLKHLLFLLAFVIAPLLCWCLLNFFHEGKCRKKSAQPPEAQPIPTSRRSTVDDGNNDDGEQPSPSVLPTAPQEMEVVVCAQPSSKCERPPSYFESTDVGCPVDCGPPPSYEDAVLGSDASIRHVWQSVYVVQQENA